MKKIILKLQIPKYRKMLCVYPLYLLVFILINLSIFLTFNIKIDAKLFNTYTLMFVGANIYLAIGLILSAYSDYLNSKNNDEKLS